MLLVRSSQFAANRLLFAPFKDLPLTDAKPEMSVRTDEDGSLTITLTGVGYHHFVHLLVADPATSFSDNYFDLRANETRMVRVACPGAMLTAADVRLQSFHC